MTIYNKTKNGAYKIGQLQKEINASTDIVPSCTGITASGTDLALDIAADLSGAEEIAMDAIILAHVPSPNTVDVSEFTFSEIDKTKLMVHPSYKPTVDGITTYAVWGGAGDELDVDGNLVDDGKIGGGPMLHLSCKTIDTEVTAVAKFHTDNGRIWLHEAYVKFDGGPEGAYLSGGIVAMGTPLQQLGGLDLEITNNIISYAVGGPGTGTHGFADADKIVLVPRSFSHDGEWNYDPLGTPPLTPAAGDGEYRIYDEDTMVHRFVNRISCRGSSPYFSITSDETTELPKHYYVQVSARREDDSAFGVDWYASILLEIYRERTYKP